MLTILDLRANGLASIGWSLISSAAPKRLIGLTGSAEQIRRVALAYKVYYAKYPPGSPDYVIDHSSFIYLLDETGKYIGFFPPSTTADRMIKIIKLHLPVAPRK